MPLLLSLALAAEPNPYPVTLAGGLAYHYAEGHGGTGVGRLLIHAPRTGWAADLAGGEGVAGSPGRHLGVVHVGARYHFSNNAYVRGGFHHQHETLYADLKADPVNSLTGSGEFINHRGGFQLGVGGVYHWWDLMPEVAFFNRLDTGADLSVAVLPGTEGPLTYVGLELWCAFHVGRKRA